MCVQHYFLKTTFIFEQYRREEARVWEEISIPNKIVGSRITLLLFYQHWDSIEPQAEKPRLSCWTKKCAASDKTNLSSSD